MTPAYPAHAVFVLLFFLLTLALLAANWRDRRPL